MTTPGETDRERWAQVEAICHEALNLSGAARAEYLARACDGDPTLRGEVEALLARTAEARGFLSEPAAIVGSAAAPDMIGRTIAEFEIVARLGAGGMGVVYRAHDRTLGRDVAIKVLPPEVATDPERLARFRREAKLLATLSHPNIGTIHGLVEEGGTCALVLELLEGETLAAGLARKPMRIDEALTVAAQVLEALDHVHRRGVTHRDLKPANVMLTRTGVKLLDFGIGKLTMPAGAARPAGFSTDTADGRIIGTPNYMAPEQLEGRAVDARSDLFAFGALFHEMLSGRPAFAGDSQASIVAAVLTSTPPALSSGAGEAIPPGLDRIVAKCLAKDPDARWQTARDLRDAVGLIHDVPLPATARAPGHRAAPWRIVAMTLAVAGIVAAAGWAMMPRPSAPDSTAVSRFVVTAPAELRMSASEYFDISPDGRHLVYQTGPETIRLMSRRLDQFDASPLTQDVAREPTFSPDGASIAYVSRRQLYRESLGGDGVPVALYDVKLPGDFNFDWSVLDTIVFAGREKPVRSMPAAGGPVTELTRLQDGEIDHHKPQILPGGRAIVFAVHKPRNRFDVVAQVLATGERKLLVGDAFAPQYSRTGHLLFGRGSAVLAAPFDAERLALTGGAVTVVENVQASPNDGEAFYRVSDSGTLVYKPERPRRHRTLVWADRAGRETPLPLAPGEYEAPRISPDGKVIAFGTSYPWRVWLYEIATERMTALTPANQTSWGPIWSADGKALLYSVDRPDRSEIVMDRLDGTTPAVMGSSVNDLWPTGFTSDGSLIVNEDPPTENFMVSRLRPGPDARPTPFADGPTTPSLSRPSPDGMWVAFNAMEGGRFQLFVQPASPGGVRRQVTVDGGREPVWRRDGRELYFRRNDEVLAMTIQPGSALTWSRPTVLFKGSYSNLGPDFDVAPDGRLLLLKEEAGPPPPSQLNVVVNWAAELQSRGVRPE